MPNARNRHRRSGRKSPFRDPKPCILIVTEGSITEPEYFRGFAQACRNSRVTVEIAPEHGVPRTVVEAARDRKREAENQANRERDDNLAYDSVWCVFDIDDHPNVSEAKDMAHDNGIGLAISNPCFELWLLLHFRDNPGMQHRSKIRDKLKEHLPNYDKHIDYISCSTGYQQAVARASRMDQDAECNRELYRNPSTGVYKVTELVRGD
jgi:RloB-like protein